MSHIALQGDEPVTIQISRIKTCTLAQKLVCEPNFCEKISETSDGLTVYGIMTKTITEKSAMNIKKVAVGHMPINNVEKVLMVVGATGSGKTTLINGMINYIFGVQFNDPFRFKLIVEYNQTSQAHSQTQTIIAYTIYRMEGSPLNHTITIVDTPGFGDTRGVKRDKQITEQIKNFFSMKGNEGIPYINGIGFVAQAALPRLTPTQKYIFGSILSVFGKNVVENIFMMLTFADNQPPTVIDAIKEDGMKCDAYFKFNNSALYAGTKDPFNKMFWEMGKLSFDTFFVNFEKSSSVSLTQTKEVLKERENLEATIQGLQPQIDEGMTTINFIEKEKRTLLDHEAEIAANKEFKRIVKKPVSERRYQSSGIYVTNCAVCHITCHYNCIYPNDSQKQNCCVMSGGYCTVCKGRCYWTNHRNDPFYYIFTEVNEEITLDTLKAKYTEATNKKATAEDMIRKLEKDLDDVRKQVRGMVKKVHDSLTKLDEIALRPNPLTEVEHLQLLIESEKSKKEPGFMERIKFYEQAKEDAEIVKKVKEKKTIL